MRLKQLSLLCVYVLGGLVVSLGAGGGASAATPAAVWSVTSNAYPTNFSTADNARCKEHTQAQAYEFCDSYTVAAVDNGAKPMGQQAVVLSDVVPAELTVQNTAIFWRRSGISGGKHTTANLVAGQMASCTVAPEGSGTLVKCTIPASYFAGQTEPNGRVQPDGMIQMIVSVTVNEPAVPSVLENRASVSGGGAESGAATGAQNTLQGASPTFGLESFASPFMAADGAFETQAGGHPYELQTLLNLHSVWREDPQGVTLDGSEATSVADLRDAIVDLPVGVAGSSASAERCTLTRVSTSVGLPAESQENLPCPQDSIVGYIETSPENYANAFSPVYNVIPEHGYTAELAFADITGTTHVLYVGLAPTPAGYVLRTSAIEVPQIALREVRTQIYGDPTASARARESLTVGDGFRYAPDKSDSPTFTDPADCTGEPLVTTVYMDSWQHPGSWNEDGTPNLADPTWVRAQTESSPAVSGCEALGTLFTPTLAVAITTGQGESPTGLDVDLSVPQQEGPESPSTPPVKETVVTLPEGMSVNPSSANGLSACSEQQIGWQGKSAVPSGEYENFTAALPECPAGSKIGTIELETPALPSEECNESTKMLEECPQASERKKVMIGGSIYVAEPYENPFGSLLAIYIVVDDPNTGLIVKIPAKVEANEATGRLTTTVPDTPQFPFSNLHTHFSGGATAALKTPDTCGAQTVSATVTPWSVPQSGPPATPSGSFEVNQAAGGGGCGAAGFSPSFSAGTEGTQAAAFSPLSISFGRNDGEQQLGEVSVTMPPGVAGIIAGIPRCEEPQASQGNCPEASLIGQASTAVGAGPSPYWVRGAKVYLTGPYDDAPFGLSVVVPTTAGPYTLTGNAGPGKEVVRASIRVNPQTAQITTVSDPLPTIIQGIPLAIRQVDIAINRPHFIYNPTSCNRMSITGALSSSAGVSVPVSSRFQVSGCQSLPFKPSFSASVGAAHTKRNGDYLKVDVTSSSGQANIAKVHVTLPKVLPSRTETLKLACLAAQFAADPAGCPAGSVVGTATAVSPVLARPLTGPAYFVSHGGVAFPNLDVVLQGEGVTVILAGSTDIVKDVTSSTFASVPDVPVTSFQLTLPAGKYSALAGEGDLCTHPLTMPTQITAQNNKQIEQQTQIDVQGCQRPKHDTRRHKSRKHTKHK